MSTAENAKIQIELGRTMTDFTAATNAGDEQVFYAGLIWSGKSGFEPDVRPNGIVSGRNLLSTTGTNDTVSVAGFTAYCKGTLDTVSSTSVTCGRPTLAGVSKITSVTMNSAGSVVTVKGAQGATSAFSETRNAAGGPPLIPTNSVELGQIRITGGTAATVGASEIHQVVGTHSERYDYPAWDEYNLGNGVSADSAAEENAHIKFASSLPTSHSNSITKQVYIKYYTPVFSDLSRTMGFVPIEQSHSISSTQVYGGENVGASSSSLGQGSFNAMLSNGVGDALVSEKNEIVTVKFFPDENKSPYILTQGKLGIARTFPVNNQIQASCTISGEDESAEFTS